MLESTSPSPKRLPTLTARQLHPIELEIGMPPFFNHRRYGTEDKRRTANHPVKKKKNAKKSKLAYLPIW